MDKYYLDFLERPISYIGYFLLIINLIVYSFSFKTKNKALRCIQLFLLLTTIIQISLKVTVKSFGMSNLHLSHYYFIGQFLILSYFFFIFFKNLKTLTFIKVTTIIVLTILTFQYYLFPNKYYEFNELEIIITSIPLLVYSFIFLLKKLDDRDNDFVYFVSSFFLYTLCNTLLFVSGNLSSNYKIYLNDINKFLYILFLVFVFIEWYKNFRKPKLAAE